MNPKVLLVDDDMNVLQGYQRLLRMRFAIEVVQGGEAALQIVRQQGPFTVVVADMYMPSMNGPELFRRIRELSPGTTRS